MQGISGLRFRVYMYIGFLPSAWQPMQLHHSPLVGSAAGSVCTDALFFSFWLCRQSELKQGSIFPFIRKPTLPVIQGWTRGSGIQVDGQVQYADLIYQWNKDKQLVWTHWLRPTLSCNERDSLLQMGPDSFNLFSAMNSMKGDCVRQSWLYGCRPAFWVLQFMAWLAHMKKAWRLECHSYLLSLYVFRG